MDGDGWWVVVDVGGGWSELNLECFTDREFLLFMIIYVLIGFKPNALKGIVI